VSERSTERIGAKSELLRLDARTGTIRAREYRVTVVAGPDAGVSIPLEGAITVGNHPGAGLVLSDPAVSRHHLELSPRPDGVRVRDLESTNGSYLAGVRIQDAIIELGQQARIALGRTELEIAVQEKDVGPPPKRTRLGSAVGQSEVMQSLFGILERVAPTDATILLLGETGTGKDVLAEAIHRSSHRAATELVIVDCGAIAPSLIESELFGHVKGAFSGAVSDRAGAFASADGGTLFLDEIGDLPLELQPKLLRAIERQTVKRVGDDRSRSVDVRIIAATHRDLEERVRAGSFRQDLYFRLAVVPIRVPPLRERVEDIPLIVRHFMREMQDRDFELSPELLARLSAYSWPGNVRELRNVVQRVLAGGAPILPEQDRDPPGAKESVLPFKEAKEKLFDEFTRAYLQDLIKVCGGNVSEMARTAGLARAHMHRLLTKHGIDPGTR
jgi:transcriptional regulator with GAF, ATPase, and Fis domain